MSAETCVASRTWRTGPYTCTLTMQRPKPGAMVACSIEWLPEQPKRLSDAEIVAYRAGRNNALAEISRQLGMNAAVLEL